MSIRASDFAHSPATASMVLDQIAMDMTKALPGIGLQLKNVKGVGFALQEAERLET